MGWKEIWARLAPKVISLSTSMEGTSPYIVEKSDAISSGDKDTLRNIQDKEGSLARKAAAAQLGLAVAPQILPVIANPATASTTAGAIAATGLDATGLVGGLSSLNNYWNNRENLTWNDTPGIILSGLSLVPGSSQLTTPRNWNIAVNTASNLVKPIESTIKANALARHIRINHPSLVQNLSQTGEHSQSLARIWNNYTGQNIKIDPKLIENAEKVQAALLYGPEKTLIPSARLYGFGAQNLSRMGIDKGIVQTVSGTTSKYPSQASKKLIAAQNLPDNVTFYSGPRIKNLQQIGHGQEHEVYKYGDDVLKFRFHRNPITYSPHNNNYSSLTDEFTSTGAYRYKGVASKFIPERKYIGVGIDDGGNLVPVFKESFVEGQTPTQQQLNDAFSKYGVNYDGVKQVTFKDGSIAQDVNPKNVKLVDGKPIIIDPIAPSVYNPNSRYYIFKPREVVPGSRPISEAELEGRPKFMRNQFKLTSDQGWLQQQGFKLPRKHLQGEDAVQMFKEYGTQYPQTDTPLMQQLRKYVPEVRERYGLVGNTNITDDEIVGSLYKKALELGGDTAAVNEVGEPLVLFRGDTKRYYGLRTHENASGSEDNLLGTLFLSDPNETSRYLVRANNYEGLVATGAGGGNSARPVIHGKILYDAETEGTQGTLISELPKGSRVLSTYNTRFGPYSIWKLPSQNSSTGVNEINGFVVRTPATRDISYEVAVAGGGREARPGEEFQWLIPKEDRIGKSLHDVQTAQNKAVINMAKENNQGLLFSRPNTPYRGEHGDVFYYALPDFNIRGAKHILPFDFRMPTQWNSRIIYRKQGGILKAQNSTELPEIESVPIQKSSTNVVKPIKRVVLPLVDNSWEISNDRDIVYYNPNNDQYVKEFFEQDVLPRYKREHPNASQKEIKAVGKAYSDPQHVYNSQVDQDRGHLGGYAEPKYRLWDLGIPLTAGSQSAYYSDKYKLSRPTVVHENTHLYRQGRLGNIHKTVPYTSGIIPVAGYFRGSGYSADEVDRLKKAYDMSGYNFSDDDSESNQEHARVIESGTTNAEVRYRIWKELYDKLGRVPTLDETDEYLRNYDKDHILKLWDVVTDTNGYGHEANKNRYNDIHENETMDEEKKSYWDNALLDALIHVANNNQKPDMTNVAKQGGVIKGQFGLSIISPSAINQSIDRFKQTKVGTVLNNFFNGTDSNLSDEEYLAKHGYNKPVGIGSGLILKERENGNNKQ